MEEDNNLTITDCTLQKQCNYDCFLFLFFFLLSNRWIPEVQQIFYLGKKRKRIPSNTSVAQLQSFYNCAATLMTTQLQSLALESIQDYTHLIAQDPVRSLVPLHLNPFEKSKLLYRCNYIAVLLQCIFYVLFF